MARKVIFLDIDGVLVTRESMMTARSVAGVDRFWPSCVNFFRSLVETVGAEIVISSSWRSRRGWESLINDEFNRCGWDNPPIVGRTRLDRWSPDKDTSEPRGQEIADWLTENLTESFIIIDDDADMLPEQMSRFVQTNMVGGFTEEHLNKCLELFGVNRKEIG